LRTKKARHLSLRRRAGCYCIFTQFTVHTAVDTD
jgi:hypothetical protein